MVTAILLMGGLGLTVSIVLAGASKIFYVYVDPLIEAVTDALPGANCGGCGYPGCAGAAEAIVSGEAPANICVAGGPDVHERVAMLMGVEVKATEPQIARPGCYYGLARADLKYEYNGILDCLAAARMIGGGPKECPIGCLGFGSCVRACPFNALSMGPEGLPVVNEKRCTGCGTCERVCPKHIITLHSNSQSVLEEYTADQCTAPCQRACPAGIDIPRYIQKIAESDFMGAVRVIKEKNPFPLVCGRICYHPCEFVCRRNLVDEPVAINYLKRFAADWEMKSGRRIETPRAPATGHRVAVVGGGAEGLTAAYFLARLGHDPTVLDAAPQMGGLLRSVIHRARLPEAVLDWEIQGILEAGVTARTGQVLGENAGIDTLLAEGFSAVFVATGGWDAQLAMGMEKRPTEVLPGVQLLAHFTLRWIHGQLPPLTDPVMIIAGGNTSLEAARLCKASGVKQVHIVLRNPAQAAPFSGKQLEAARAEGIQIHFRRALAAMQGQGRQLTRVTLCDSEDSGKTETVDVRTLLIGAGRFPELIYVLRENAEEPSATPAWETVAPYPGPSACSDACGIFRPGEATTDYKAVVAAIGAGRRAANAIHQYLTGEPVDAPEHMLYQDSEVLNVSTVHHAASSPRNIMPLRDEAAACADPYAEIELGFSKEQALREASRCLQCGLLCYRKEPSAFEETHAA